MMNKDGIVAELKQLVEKQAKQILALMAEVEQLKLQLAKATKNSSNSSKSPSSDITKPKDVKTQGKRGRPKKRKIGGQPGREKKLREPLPPDRVNETYEGPDGSIYYQHDPEIHGQPIFGPRLLAMVSWMKSRAHCSYRLLELRLLLGQLFVCISRTYVDSDRDLPEAREELLRLSLFVDSSKTKRPTRSKPNRLNLPRS